MINCIFLEILTLDAFVNFIWNLWRQVFLYMLTITINITFSHLKKSMYVA